MVYSELHKSDDEFAKSSSSTTDIHKRFRLYANVQMHTDYRNARCRLELLNANKTIYTVFVKNSVHPQVNLFWLTSESEDKVVPPPCTTQHT